MSNTSPSGIYTFSNSPGMKTHIRTTIPWGNSVMRKRPIMAQRKRFVLPSNTDRFLVVKENLLLLLYKECTRVPTSTAINTQGSSLPTMAYNRTLASTRV
jgi:hypothetical protein